MGFKMGKLFSRVKAKMAIKKESGIKTSKSTYFEKTFKLFKGEKKTLNFYQNDNHAFCVINEFVGSDQINTFEEQLSSSDEIELINSKINDLLDLADLNPSDSDSISTFELCSPLIPNVNGILPTAIEANLSESDSISILDLNSSLFPIADNILSIPIEENPSRLDRNTILDQCLSSIPIIEDIIDSYVGDEEIQQKEERLTVQLNHNAENAALRLAHKKELQATKTRNLSLQKRNDILESAIIEVKISLLNKDEQLRQQAADAQELEHQRHELERQPESSSANALREKEYLLSKALAIAQREAQLNYSRMRDLSDALQASPNHVANIKGVLEEKDLQFFNLEKKALLYQAELIKVERDARFFRMVTMDELFNQHRQVDSATGAIKFLEERLSNYQEECEALHKMLRSKVTESGYFQSLERYQELLLNDQQLLTARLKEKDSEIAYAEDKTGLLEVDLQELRCKMEIKEQEKSEVNNALASKSGEVLLLKAKVWHLGHSLAAMIKQYNALLEMKNQEVMKPDSTRQLGIEISDATGLVHLEEKVKLVLKGKDERIEELEKSVDELRNENKECFDELGGLREVSAVNAKDAVYAQYYLGTAMSELRAVDEDRFERFKQGLTESYEIQSLQARLSEARENAKENHIILEDKVDKLQRYASVIRGLGFDLISKLQGDETSLENWSLEDIYEALNSQVHLLNEKGKARADGGHDSGVEKFSIDGRDDGRIHSYRDGQDDAKSGQGTRYEESNANVAGRESKLDRQHNDLGTLPSGERHDEESGGPRFAGEGHNYDRDRPLFSDESYNFENLDLFSDSACPVRVSPATPMRAERLHGRGTDHLVSRNK